jgi:hypothetical protein
MELPAGIKGNMAMARHTFSNCSRISMVRSKLNKFGKTPY